MIRNAETTTLDDSCGKAMNLQLAGELTLAEQLYRSILREQPKHTVANHCLGMLQVQLRRPQEGLPFLLAALGAQPEIPDYWLGYLEALLLVGQKEAAIEALALGRQHGLSGDAVDDLTARLAKTPRQDSASSEPSSGTTARANSPRRPRHPKIKLPKARRDSRTASELGRAVQTLISKKRIPEALAVARSMTERFPGHGPGWKQLGALLWWQGKCDEAFTPMEHSVRLLPQDAEAQNNFGMALHRRERIDEATVYFQRALDIDPGFAAAHYHLGMIYAVAQSFAEAESSLRTAVALRPDYLDAEVRPVYSDLLFLFSHNPMLDGDSLFEEHRRFGALIEKPLRASWPRHANTKDPERRLQVGFLSGDLRDHAVAVFLEPILERLAQLPNLELHAYYNFRSEDWMTVRLRRYFHHWHQIADLTDAAVADDIATDDIDVLVDLYGHTGLNRLSVFARKPAPIQVSWLGYPGTTGLTAMDYYLADRHWLPPGQFDHVFTEKLVYLPDRWAFQANPDSPPVNPLPALTSGHLTFGSFHRLNKINDSTLRLWCDLLLALPRTSLLLAGILPGEPRKKLIERFAAHGIPRERLDFHERCSVPIYLALHHRVDLALDTHPYAGGTTTMQSLSMGVPTLTLAGNTPAGRAGAGILGQIGLEGFTATNGADFVAKGLYWAQHLAELAQVRAGLPARLRQSPGGQPALFAAHFAGALRHMWRRWCAGLPAESFHSSVLEPDA